jgi:hypothetical protein
VFMLAVIAPVTPAPDHPAGWQSGHAAACKAVYAGSIPTPASKPAHQSLLVRGPRSLGREVLAVSLPPRWQATDPNARQTSPLSLAEARVAADRARAQVAEGHHLTAVKRTEKLQRRFAAANTFDAVAAPWSLSDTRDCRSLAVARTICNSRSRNAMPNPKVRHRVPQQRQISLRAYIAVSVTWLPW